MTHISQLKISRTVSTGIMVFYHEDYDKYEEIETFMISEFYKQPFGDVVHLNFDDDEFCHYYLTADLRNETELKDAAVWVLAKMEEFETTLERVL